MRVRTCVVDTATGAVVNVIEIDDAPTPVSKTVTPDIQAPIGYRWIAHPTADMTWTWNGSALVPPSYIPSFAEARMQAARQLAEKLAAPTLEDIITVLNSDPEIKTLLEATVSNRRDKVAR